MTSEGPVTPPNPNSLDLARYLTSMRPATHSEIKPGRGNPPFIPELKGIVSDLIRSHIIVNEEIIKAGPAP